MNEFIRKSGKRPKSVILALLLLFVPALFLSAQQSFFIPPGQTIRNGDVADGYCLEYSKPVLSNGNIANLTRITGDVLVVYNNMTSAVRSLQSLVNDGLVRFNAFDSYRHLQFLFTRDSGIEAIITGEEGLGLFPEKLTPEEDRLTRENITRILDLETRGLVHSVIQDTIWKTLFPLDRSVEGVRTIDFQTTADPAEQVHTRFGGNATVDYRRNEQKFMRLDGILNSTEDFSPEITELVSHFHNDHISLAALKNLLETVNFASLFAPNVIRDDSKNETFNLLTEAVNNMGLNPEKEFPVLGVPGADFFIPLYTLSGGSMGDFYYVTFNCDADISVVIFKYKKPKNPNTDGAIYHITHNQISYLLFGDFDDPEGINNLLDASVENEKRVNSLQEEQAVLYKQLYEYRDELTKLVSVYDKMPPGNGETAAPDNEALFRITVLERLLDELRVKIINVRLRIDKTNNEIASLPVLKADVVKWPHHAHIFREANSREVIIKLNQVVNPRYFIYQVHSAQDLKDFDAYIEGFDFSKKFINSGVQPVKFISMEWLKGRFLGLFTGKQGKAS